MDIEELKARLAEVKAEEEKTEDLLDQIRMLAHTVAAPSAALEKIRLLLSSTTECTEANALDARVQELKRERDEWRTSCELWEREWNDAQDLVAELQAKLEGR